jgi:hypothetical protein
MTSWRLSKNEYACVCVYKQRTNRQRATPRARILIEKAAAGGFLFCKKRIQNDKNDKNRGVGERNKAKLKKGIFLR